MNATVGCFLYTKLILDIIALLVGGFAAYLLIKFQYYVFYPIAFPFVKLDVYTSSSGKRYQRYVARKYTASLNKIFCVFVVSVVLLGGVGGVTYAILWPFLKFLYHRYMAC